MSGHFDTRMGPKVKSESYVNIVRNIDECDAKSTLFLSDNVLGMFNLTSFNILTSLRGGGCQTSRTRSYCRPTTRKRAAF